MFVLCSLQIDQFNITNLRVKKFQFKLDFSTTATSGTTIFLSLNPQMSGPQLIFAQNIVVDSRSKTSVIMSCDDQVLEAQCIEQLSNLKKNIKVDITFELSWSRLTIFDLRTSVDTFSNSSQIAIIVGCSVGGVVLIALIAGIIYMKRRSQSHKHHLLSEVDQKINQAE
ncbi:Hypothetical_protein [Hexamita inflata]|uniref:Hypothetical_protein n=1 Tax=Hexamita inflata TaxID=28002 RepID=A0AA86NXK9_9EUKA|nr:Hypothetical protein HINF_LOCUS14214 [Hexamita inflata]